MGPGSQGQDQIALAWPGRPRKGFEPPATRRAPGVPRLEGDFRDWAEIRQWADTSRRSGPMTQGNLTISVGALSYAGQLNFDVVGDPDAVPDLAVFAGGLADTLDQLGVLDRAERGQSAPGGG